MQSLVHELTCDNKKIRLYVPDLGLESFSSSFRKALYSDGVDPEDRETPRVRNAADAASVDPGWVQRSSRPW